MINRFTLLRNIGQYHSVAIPHQLQKISVIYGENGRGKSTLAAILRSYATGDPLPITERKRLGVPDTPHIVLDCSTAQQPAMFQNNAWSRTRPNIAIFDDVFVNENIYSGLSVEPEHRQNLHELIIGAQGVALNGQVQHSIALIEEHNAALRRKAGLLPTERRGGLSVDDFCLLPPQDGIDDAIERVQRELAAVREQDPVRNTGVFESFGLPALNMEEIQRVLQQDLEDLDVEAAARIKARSHGVRN